MTPKLCILKQETFIVSYTFWGPGIWEWLSWAAWAQGFPRGWRHAVGQVSAIWRPSWGWRVCCQDHAHQGSRSQSWRPLEASVPQHRDLPVGVFTHGHWFPSDRETGVSGGERAPEMEAPGRNNPMWEVTHRYFHHRLPFARSRNLSCLIL